MEKDTDTLAKPRPKRRWLWLFRLTVLIFILAVFFSLLEFSLRVSGFGYPTSFFVKTSIRGQVVHVDNEKFAWRFFPRKLTRYPVPLIFPEVKTKDTYRIFIMGGSAALGAPNPSFGFGRILDVFLRHHFPGVRFEVVNTCLVAINSHVILEIAKDCAKLQPDLFIVYTGNNEVVGPFGAGTIFSPLSSSLSLVRASLAFESTRIGQLMEALLGSKGSASSLRKWEGMTMFLENQVRHDDPAMKLVYQHFGTNLSDICSLARECNVPIAVGTVATNLKDCAPFASLHRSDLATDQKEKWEGIYQNAAELESTGDFSRAIALFLEAAEIDNQYAELHYRLGRCYWSLQQYQDARRSFVRAREYDTLRFRADTRINDSIRAEVEGREDQGIYLVDIEKTVSENSPHSTPGGELFYEHVHLRFDGNFLMAQNVFRRIESALPEWIRRQAPESVTPLTSEECAKRLAYTDWDKHNNVEEVLNSLIKRPPFTNQLNNGERVSAMEKQLELLGKTFKVESVMREMFRQYQQAIKKRESDVWIRQNFGSFLERIGKDYKASEEHRRFGADAFPHKAMFLQVLGRTLRLQGKLDEAKVLLEEALRMRPETVEVLVQLGMVFAELGNKTEATRIFQKAIEVDPSSVEAHYNFAVAHVGKWGQLEEGIGEFLEVVRLAPDDVQARTQLGTIYGKLKRFPEALQQYREAIRIKPDYAQAYYGQGVTHITMGNTTAAMRSLVRLGKLDTKLAQDLYRQVLKKNPELLKKRARPRTPKKSR